MQLRPYKKSDAETIVAWIKDEVLFRQWCADRYEHYPITAADMNMQYDMCADAGFFCPMTAYDDSGIVGHLIMRYIDEDKKILRFGFIIVDDTKRGMGYGRELLRLALQYASEHLHASKATLGVFENNESAYRCYQSVGFRDVAQAEPEYYHVLDEEWKCLEMEYMFS